MSKFKQLFNLIMEGYGGSLHHYTAGIPRPERLKTPPNNYGNTGANARYYDDRYVQDTAEDIYIDKYGEERGHKLWEGIIYKGNAMFQACDEILGELRTMTDLNFEWVADHPEVKAASDYQKFLNDGGEQWIYQWTFWILTVIIDGPESGYSCTHNFISTCIPTFKWFLEKYPETFGILLKQAGIGDINNYKLSKKIQAKVDKKKAEEEAALKAFQKAEEEAARKKEEADKAAAKNAELVEQYGDKFGPMWKKKFTSGKPEDYIYNLFDLSVGVDNIINLPKPTNKDQQRICDIIAKSQGQYNYRTNQKYDSIKQKWKNVSKGWHFEKGDTPDITKCVFYKAKDLAREMNNKITDEKKRAARKAAAEKYGLTFIAECFE